jgi:threonine synthase
MDVGNPSNFVRILEMFDNNTGSLQQVLSSCSVDDATTAQTIVDVYNKYGYMPDPHGAVGYYALYKYLSQHTGEKGIFLETAHPVKFPEVVEQATNTQIAFPESVQYLTGRKKLSIAMDASFAALKEWLMAR